MLSWTNGNGGIDINYCFADVDDCRCTHAWHRNQTDDVVRMMKNHKEFVRSTLKPFAINSKRKSSYWIWWIYQAGKAAEKSGCISPQLNTKSKPVEKVVGLGGFVKTRILLILLTWRMLCWQQQGNPLGNYAFTFPPVRLLIQWKYRGRYSVASDLEPVKNIQVGLHSGLVTVLYEENHSTRIITDSRGHFPFGIAPGDIKVSML